MQVLADIHLRKHPEDYCCSFRAIGSLGCMEATRILLEDQVVPMGAPKTTAVAALGCLHKTWTG